MAQPQKSTPEIRIVKKKIVHGGHHGGAWKVAYADFVTAMMAFFLVMWIVGLSPDVKQAIAGYFKDPVAFNKALDEAKASAAFDVGNSTENTGKFDKTPGTVQDQKDDMAAAIKTIEQIINETPEFKDLKDSIDIKMVSEGLQIELLEGKKSLFFDGGSANIKPYTRDLLARIAKEVGKLPNQVMIEGHTDSLALNRPDGYTNWELSSDRANSARKVMQDSGLHNGQVGQVRGYADTKPKDPAHPESAFNRRVSIIVAYDNKNGNSTPETPIKLNIQPEAKSDVKPVEIEIKSKPEPAKEIKAASSENPSPKKTTRIDAPIKILKPAEGKFKIFDPDIKGGQMDLPKGWKTN